MQSVLFKLQRSNTYIWLYNSIVNTLLCKLCWLDYCDSHDFMYMCTSKCVHSFDSPSTLTPPSSTVNLGTLATLGAHAIFAFLPNQSFIALIAMILMGVAYSMLACALWPLVAFIVPEYQLGTAYGM